MAVLPSRLGVTVLSHPLLMKIAPGVVAVVRVKRIQRRRRHRRCVRGPTGPRKRTEAVIHNKPIGESELFIIINENVNLTSCTRDVDSLAYSLLESPQPRACLGCFRRPWRMIGCIKGKRRNLYRISAGGEEQRNSSGWRCVRGERHRPVFEDMKRRDGCLETCKRQPQLIGGEASLHQCRRDNGTR